MQSRNWNDLRFLLAVKRGQTLRAAARQLHVDDTTYRGGWRRFSRALVRSSLSDAETAGWC